MLLTCNLSVMTPAHVAPAEAATAAAFAAVGMYGDPTVSWSIYLDVELAAPVAPDLLRRRLTEEVAAHPHLGLPPEWSVVPEQEWARALRDIGDRLYRADGPLVRGCVTTDGSRLAIAAHHGAVDGLGLVALVGATTGTRLTSRARGIAAAPAERPFLRTCVDRGMEALVRNPRRFRAQHRSGAVGDWMLTTPTTVPMSTGLLIAAVGEVLQEWGAQPDGRRHPTVMAVAASRRPAGEVLRPDRDTAYLRLVDVSPGDVGAARDQLAATAPEPDFPSSRVGGLAPMATRLLQPRLGSTVLISNVGRVDGAEGIRSMAILPTASGPSGLAVGAMTAGETGTLSVRARRNAFTEAGARRLLDSVHRTAERLAR